MKIVVSEVEPWEREAFASLAEKHRIDFLEGALGPENAGHYRDADVLSPFIYSKLTAELLACFPRLKLIATRSTGFDHIDLDYCRGHAVAVSNVPTYGDNTVAEHVFGLLLTISHHLHEAIERTRRGDFSLQGLQGFDLKGKTLGVVGTGAIGRCVIQIARGFQMDVVAFDVHPSDELAARLGFRYAEMDELLSASDIITLHVPATKATHHLIGADEFARMKKGVVFINTARGGVVDVVALVGALESGKVAAAGLDVLPEEPAIREEAELIHSVYQEKYDLRTLLADQILMHRRNVYVTPHSAFDTREATGRIQETTVDNIAAFAAGEPQHVVVAGLA